MEARTAMEIIGEWPEESREAAELVIDRYGMPHEASASVLIWHHVGPWKRVVASKTWYHHEFPAPHTDSVESFIDYRVPTDMVTPLADFDGSVIVERTAGEVSARCHDEEANRLALNLMHDVVTGAKSVSEAREYYATEFLDARRNRPTPYMEQLRFDVAEGGTGDPDQPVFSDDDLEAATADGNTAD